MVKTLKICKDMKSKYASYRERDGSAGLLPEKYKETLRAGVMGNHSCYELHSSFSSVYESDPVCNVCLLPIEGRGGKASTVEYCHYACFNLLVKLQEESHSQ